jgi:hypothetical protein
MPLKKKEEALVFVYLVKKGFSQVTLFTQAWSRKINMALIPICSCKTVYRYRRDKENRTAIIIVIGTASIILY